MTDIQEMYSVLLARRYQEELFSLLQGQKPAKGGRETTATCPFCLKAGKFSYSSEQPVWKCWHCGECGDWLKYLEKADGLDFQGALALLAKAAGLELTGADQAKHTAYTRKADLLDRAQELFVQALQEPAGRPVLQYLEGRGYTAEDIKSMEFGAYVDKAGLQKALLKDGYSEQETRDSGLLTAGFGSDYTLSLLWRDAAGRAIGIATRAILPEEKLKAKSLSKYKYSYGLQKEQGLIGLTTARGAKAILLVEGVLDALYLSSKGLAVVGIGGTSLSSHQIKALQDNGTQELLLCLDTDEAGQTGTEKAIKQLRASKLRGYVVSLPAGCKDPDELVRKQGLQPLKEAMAKAERGSAWMARRIISQHNLQTPRGLDKALDEALEMYAELEDKIEQRDYLAALEASTGLSAEDLALRASDKALKASHRRSAGILEATLKKAGGLAGEGDILGAEEALASGILALRSSRRGVAPEPYLLEDLERDISTMSTGLSTGYNKLDELFRIPAGALSIVAGRPGQGKTSLQLNLLLKMATAYRDKAFYFYSYEEAARPLALKLIMILAGKVLHDRFNLGAYTNYLKEKRGTEKAIEEAISEYQELTSSGRLWLMDSRLSAEDLASTIGHLARRREVGAVLVDYIQKVPLQKPIQGQRYLEIKRVSELLLEQAVSQDIAIILGAQLGRASGSESKVRLDNLRESGDIEQDANLVLGLYSEALEKAEETDQKGQANTVPLQITVLKNRQGVAGLSQSLDFERPTLRLTDSHW
jgi:DNA primase